MRISTLMAGWITIALLIPLPSLCQIIKPAPERPLAERMESGNIWEYSTEKYWWGYTLTQARDKILSEPGWKLDVDNTDPNETLLRAATENGQAVLLLAFFKKSDGKKEFLYRRSYAYPIGSAIVTEWNTQLAALPYDNRNSTWDEQYTHAHIKRSYVSNWVMYTVELYYENVNK